MDAGSEGSVDAFYFAGAVFAPLVEHDLLRFALGYHISIKTSRVDTFKFDAL